MTTARPGERWPFTTGGGPITDGLYERGASSATVALVSAAAEAMDADPLALPPLNDRIDPECLEPLATERSTQAPTGVRVAVEASFGEVSALVTDDGRVEVYSDGREPNRLVRPIAVTHDWVGDGPLFWSLGEAVADSSGARPNDIATRLVEEVDSDAAGRVIRPLFDGSERVDSRLLVSVDGYEAAVGPDGSITVEPSLAVLKRAGAAILLTGSVPEREFDRASARLLGARDEVRHPVFVLHGRNLETARNRLSMAGFPPASATVLDYRARARGASAAASANAERAPNGDRGPRVVPVGGGTRTLREAVRAAIGDDAASPGEVRVCVDSLGSMIDSNGLAATREEIGGVCRLVRERRGIGHFSLDLDADSEEVEALAPLFDAVVELRPGDMGTEQRWRLTGTGHETGWFRLR
jgi:hypothetical protein